MNNWLYAKVQIKMIHAFIAQYQVANTGVYLRYGYSLSVNTSVIVAARQSLDAGANWWRWYKMLRMQWSQLEAEERRSREAELSSRMLGRCRDAWLSLIKSDETARLQQQFDDEAIALCLPVAHEYTAACLCCR